jgi:hypothetical protein
MISVVQTTWHRMIGRETLLVEKDVERSSGGLTLPIGTYHTTKTSYNNFYKPGRLNGGMLTLTAVADLIEVCTSGWV